MTTRPGFIWSGSEWVAIGQEAVVAPVSYQTSAPSTPSTGDIWIDSNDDVPGIDTSQFLRWRKTMAGGETSVSGTDDNGLTLTYTPNYEQVYLNGVLLVRGQDYTATNGTSITGLTALAANDVVEVYGVVARVVGDVYTQAQTNSLLDAKSNVSTTGLVLLNTTTVSAATSVNFNNVFTSTYQNYLISGNLTASSAGEILVRMRVNGVDATGADYSDNFAAVVNGTVSASTLTGATSARVCYFITSNVNTTFNTNVMNPQLTSKTNLSAMSSMQNASGNSEGALVFGFHNQAVSYDGFTLYKGSGNFTGTIKVYGYK
jgi:hypothetical protein